MVFSIENREDQGHPVEIEILEGLWVANNETGEVLQMEENKRVIIESTVWLWRNQFLQTMSTDQFLQTVICTLAAPTITSQTEPPICVDY